MGIAINNKGCWILMNLVTSSPLSKVEGSGNRDARVGLSGVGKWNERMTFVFDEIMSETVGTIIKTFI